MTKILEKLREKFEVDDTQAALINAMEDAFSENMILRGKDLDAKFEDFKKTSDNSALIADLKNEIESLKTQSRSKNFPTLKRTLEENYEKIKKRGGFSLNYNPKRRDIEPGSDSESDVVIMTMANAISSDLKKLYAVDLGWDEIRYPDNFIVDVIGGRQVANVPKSVRKELEMAVEGNAELVEPSGLKPVISTTLDVAFFERMKVAAYFAWEDELEQGVDALFSKIVELLEKQVIRDWKTEVFNWLIANATTYVSSVLDETQVIPTLPAVISATGLQIASLNYTPNVCYMNLADIERAKFEQTATGLFILPPNGTLSSTMRVYADNSIEVGKILIGDSSTVGEIHTGIQMRFGGITSDVKFENNQEACAIEIYFLPYLLERNEGSWIYGDIDTIIALLQKPETTEGD